MLLCLPSMNAMEWVASDAHFPICLLFLPIYFSFVGVACTNVFRLVFWLWLHTWKWYGGETKERDRMHVLCERERDKEKAMKMERVKHFWGIKGRREASIEWAFGVKLWLYWLCGRYTEVNYKRNMAECNTYTQAHIQPKRPGKRMMNT